MSKKNKKFRRKKKYYWERIKDPIKRAKAKAKFDAGLITFNRKEHPSTKFKNIIDYAEIQKNFLRKNQKPTQCK